MMTTARDNLDDELRTRLVSTKANETQDQTIAIIKRSFSTNSDVVTTEEKEKWIAFQRWLALDGPYEVVIPYIDAIGDSFDDLANNPGDPKEYPLRARRDATALKAAIGASAILHKAQRELDGSGSIIATLDDYRLAHDVIDPSSADAHHIVISETTLAVVEAIEKLGASKTEPVKVTVRVLRDKLGISSSSTAAARLYEAVDAGLIEIVKQPSGEPYADRAPRYYKIVSSSKETKEMIKTGHTLRVFPTADEIATKTKEGAHPRRTAEQPNRSLKKSRIVNKIKAPPLFQTNRTETRTAPQGRIERPKGLNLTPTISRSRMTSGMLTMLTSMLTMLIRRAQVSIRSTIIRKIPKNHPNPLMRPRPRK
jgi:hypothetical protein